MNFKNLHEQDQPLLLCNVWDVTSAKVAEELGFAALGTSSAAMTAMLGYPDGEAMTFDELLYLVRRILANTQLPLSVDLESGYSRESQVIAEHIKQLVQEGVEGINLEDSVVGEQRTLLDAKAFAATIAAVKNQLQEEGVAVFLNIRTDTFLLSHTNPIAETKRRIQYYGKAGADGIFVPCMIEEKAIKTIVGSTDLPINVMGIPGLPDFSTLQVLGIKRISMGNFPFNTMYQFLEKTLTAVKQQQSINPIFS